MTENQLSTHRDASSEAQREDGPWIDGRLGVAAIVLFFGIFGGWAAFAPLDAGVVAGGEVKVAGNREVIQHRDGGVISRVAVREGQHVDRGQVLVELSAVELSARERALASQAIELEASRERLLAETLGKDTMDTPASWSELPVEYREFANAVLERQKQELQTRKGSLSAQVSVLGQRGRQTAARIGGLQQQIIAIEEQQRLVQQQLEGLRSLLDEGFVSANRVRDLERVSAELAGRRADLVGAVSQSNASIGETQFQALSVKEDRAKIVAEELRQTETRIAEVIPELLSVRAQLERARVRATTSGRIVGLGFFNAGAVVRPGDRILDIVPDNQDLVMEVRVQPKDADNVFPGQAATVRLPALEGKQLPMTEGQVLNISADRLEDARTGQLYFTAQVRIAQSEMKKIAVAMQKKTVPLSPGQPVEVVIPLRKRTALQYLVEPLSGAVWKSFRQS